MSKTKRILEITNRQPALSSREISEIVGCHHSYVRTTWHRNGIFKGEHDPNVNYDKRKVIVLKVEDYRKLCEKAGIKSEY